MATQDKLKAVYEVRITTDNAVHTVGVIVDIHEDDQYWQLDNRAKGLALFHADQDAEYFFGESIQDSESVVVQATMLELTY